MNYYQIDQNKVYILLSIPHPTILSTVSRFHYLQQEWRKIERIKKEI